MADLISPRGSCLGLYESHFMHGGPELIWPASLNTLESSLARGIAWNFGTG